MTWGKLAAGVESQPQKGMSDMTTETHVQITEAEVAEERSRTTTKKEMVDRIAASTQQSRSDVKRTIQAFLDEVIEEGIAAMQTESKVRTAILDGMDPQEAYRQYGKF